MVTALVSFGAEWAVDVESGVADTPSNTFRIPGSGGTRVSFSDDFDVDAVVYARYRLTYHPNARTTWSALIAPLEFSGTGVAQSDIRFTDVTFPAGSALQATYRFDSYRLTYRRNYRVGEPFSYGLGATVKIRDAEIALAGNGRSARDANTGLVPLLHFRGQWQLTARTAMLLEGDALAAPQGRAEDVMLALTYRATPDTTLRIGYRILEGGADNDDVYTFALVNYALLGIEQRF
jgi:hypothetical protein